MEHSIIANGDLLELSVSGKFTFADNKVFGIILDDIVKKAYKKVVVDLSSVEFIDSAALGILLLTRDKCKKVSANLVLKNPQGQVRQMFEISRFNELFTIEQ